METINQAPQISLVERQKSEAGKFVAGRLESIMKEDSSLSLLTAAHKVHEEVKGNNYREEQAIAKVLEYLTMKNEVDMRGGEITRTYGALSSVVEGRSGAANDEKYLVAA